MRKKSELRLAQQQKLCLLQRSIELNIANLSSRLSELNELMFQRGAQDVHVYPATGLYDLAKDNSIMGSPFLVPVGQESSSLLEISTEIVSSIRLYNELVLAYAQGLHYEDLILEKAKDYSSTEEDEK